MELFFYLPHKYLNDNYLSGAYTWILNTYNAFKSKGINCALATTIPKSGIIIFHKETIEDSFRPNIHQLLVCIEADWGRHSFAPIHITQNPNQANKINPIFKLFWPMRSYFVHHWPQPDLIPRNYSRNDRIKNLCFYGIQDNLAPDLKSDDWRSFINSNNLQWHIIENPDKWNDYTETDIVLICRDFEGNPYHQKPATKLTNAWLAGVLPIHTPESAYMAEISNKSAASITVNTYEELKNNILNLTCDKTYYLQLLENAKKYSALYTKESITNEWIELIDICKKELDSQKSHPLKFYFFIQTRKVLHLLRLFLA